MHPAWKPYGYPVQGVFPGVGACRFRLCHMRDDGLAVMTVGDYRQKGRLEPLSVMPGFNFVSFVVRVPEGDGEAKEVAMKDRAACQDWATATAQHLALLDAWSTREIPLERDE